MREENVAFVEFSRAFRRNGLPVPQIYAEDLDQGAYLEEDLGDLTLFQFLSEHRKGDEIAPEVVEAYRKVVAILPRFQVEMRDKIDYKVCYPRASFDRQSIAWDLNYFKYYFLRLAGIPFNEQALEDDFARLTEFLLEADSNYFLYRDFQSRNVMLVEGQSVLSRLPGRAQGRAAIRHRFAAVRRQGRSAAGTASATAGALPRYAWRTFLPLDREKFLRYYYAFVYVRVMQALGAYGFRGFFERKPVFLQSVPYALKNIRWLLHNAKLPMELPALMEVFTAMLGSEKLQGFTPEPEKLTVRMTSFSFHRGLPSDDTGHGGGFVFDARSLPNPGREEQYKPLTGKDAPVADYLNQQESVHQYFANVKSLVDASVSSYQARGFKNLAVSFGCTGGQHRSVYLAEQMAKHLRERGVEVVLRHRELEGAGR